MSGDARPAGPVLRDRACRHAHALSGRARAATSRYPMVSDVLLVAAVGAVSVAADVFDPGFGGSAWVVDVLLAAPLLVRRRWPVEVFAAVSAVALVQWLSGVQAHDFAVLVALYTVGAYELRRRWTLAAAVVAEVGVVLATLRWAPPGRHLTAALLLTGTVTAACVGGVYVRTRREYLAAILGRAAAAEQDRDSQARLAVAAERARIAREMHDVVAHSLSVIIALNDGAAASAMAEPQETRLAVQQASAIGRQSLGEMRRLLGVLRTGEQPELAPQPGADALVDLVGQVRAAGLPVELAVSGDPGQVPAGAQLAVHRIVQESLTNVLKHAPTAARTLVRVDYRPHGIDLEIESDDPRPAPGPVQTGHGLAGMRERAAVYGGQVQAGRGDDGRWRVSTRLRLDDRVARP